MSNFQFSSELLNDIKHILKANRDEYVGQRKNHYAQVLTEEIKTHVTVKKADGSKETKVFSGKLTRSDVEVKNWLEHFPEGSEIQIRHDDPDQNAVKHHTTFEETEEEKPSKSSESSEDVQKEEDEVDEKDDDDEEEKLDESVRTSLPSFSQYYRSLRTS